MRRKTSALMLFLTLVSGLWMSAAITVGQLPEELVVHRSGSAQLNTFLPVSVDIGDGYPDSADAKLFGMVGVKKVGIRREEPKRVILAGTLFGLRMFSDGVMVVGLADFASGGKKVNPARDAGISRGDVIRKADGKRIYTNEAFAKAVSRSDGAVTLEVTGKDGQSRSIRLTPATSDSDGSLKTGMWIRDSAAGIGTLTYIDPESGRFGGLGHGICDADTREIVPVHDGEIVSANISGIKRGVRGSAGEIRGYLSGDTLGKLENNTVCGAFGSFTSDMPASREYDVALKQEVRQGKARLMCSVEPDGKPRMYDVVINRINYGGNPAKNMIITVTDKKLLEKTGGIIQGMSGSPLVQDGKFIGAVTHVFVNDPASGYAIFAENMIGQQN